MTADRSTTAANGGESGGGLVPRHKSALLWGTVGTLTFLVLLQGYALFIAPPVTIVQGIAIALLVGIGAATGTYFLESHVARWATDRSRDD
ncbi:hypothetical protein [Halosolutus gelatinilyticus]|uniref:hypothetical protein n=1 Tax=Halosolutus gelatinilyticus TaxID=2931975 RepID=UPI001FF3F0AC|nr:hypothetical protein [Halosolutus gelatinilyticus]